MAKKRPVSGLKPGVFTGRHPDTGIVHRLTVTTDGKITIERKPYVSDNADRWTQSFSDLTCEASKHEFLLLKIKANPCDWDE